MNPNITWEIVRDEPNIQWNWNSIPENPNITWEIVRNEPDFMWYGTAEYIAAKNAKNAELRAAFRREWLKGNHAVNCRDISSVIEQFIGIR
jgi:hypothetical protein